MPSLCWKFFALNNEKNRAFCKFCDTNLSYTNKSTTNLIRHVREKHRAELEDLKGVQAKTFGFGTSSGKNQRWSGHSSGSSLCWKFLTLNIEKTKAICNLCGAHIAYANKSTTNLIRHVREKHRTEYEGLDEMQTNGTSSDKNHRPGPSFYLHEEDKVRTGTPKISWDPPMDRTLYKRDSTEKKTIDSLILDMVVLDMQPLTVVDDIGFRNLINRLDMRYEIVSRSHLRKVLLPERYREEKSKLVQELQEISYMATTTDHWTSRANDLYATLTAHYITDDWSLKSPVLYTYYSHGSRETVQNLSEADGSRKTVQNFSEELASAVREFGIEDKVTACVTDNAKNATNSVSLIEADQHNCFAHILNLTVNDAIEKDDPTQEIVMKVKEIAAYFHHCTQATKVLEDVHANHNTKFEKLKQEVETRWNSKFMMLTSYINQHEQVTMALCLQGKQEMCLSTLQLECVKNALDTLAPFYEATTELSGEQWTSISKIIPMVKALKRVTANKRSSLAECLTTAINERFWDIEREEILSFSTLLDPRFKEQGFSDSEQAQTAVLRLITEVEMMSNGVDQCDNWIKKEIDCSTVKSKSSIWEEFDSVGKEEEETRTKLKSSIWEEYDSVDGEEETPTADAELEVTTYLKTKRFERQGNPLIWWKMQETIFPRLAKLTKKILCIPATSVPSERVFSKTGELVSAKRANIKTSNVDMIVFLNKRMNQEKGRSKQK